MSSYDFHYPPILPEEDIDEWHEESTGQKASEWHEEPTGPRASLEKLVKDTKEEIVFREKTEREKQIEIKKYREIYGVVNNDMFRRSLDILSDIEVITEQQKDNYLQAKSDLLLMLDRRINPDHYAKPGLLEMPLASIIAAIPTGFITAISASIAADVCNMPRDPQTGILFLGGWGAAALLCGTAYHIYSRIAYSRTKKKLDKIKNLDRAYDAFLEALEPFRNFDIEDRKYNPKKAEKYDREKIVEATSSIRAYGKTIYDCVSKA